MKDQVTGQEDTDRMVPPTLENKYGDNVDELFDVVRGGGFFTTDYTTVLATTDISEVGGVHHYAVVESKNGTILSEVRFQNGPVKEAGINGVHNEDLLLMVLNRLQHFQDGPFACRENALAITKIEEAVMWLRKRTLDRQVRGVEGTRKI